MSRAAPAPRRRLLLAAASLLVARSARAGVPTAYAPLVIEPELPQGEAGP